MSEKVMESDVLKKYEAILMEEKKTTMEIIDDIDNMQKRGSKDSAGDLSSYSIHQADQGSDTIEMEKNVYILTEQQKKLKAINYALKKIYERSFGVCEICGDEIPEKRLHIIPYARFCVCCEEKEEKTKKNKQ